MTKNKKIYFIKNKDKEPVIFDNENNSIHENALKNLILSLFIDGDQIEKIRNILNFKKISLNGEMKRAEDKILEEKAKKTINKLKISNLEILVEDSKNKAEAIETYIMKVINNIKPKLFLGKIEIKYHPKKVTFKKQKTIWWLPCPFFYGANLYRLCWKCFQRKYFFSFFLYTYGTKRG
jgi:hypothetical protein